jgi:hypothetical protein
MGLVQAVVWTAMDGDGGFGRRRFGWAHFIGGFERTGDLDTEVA